MSTALTALTGEKIISPRANVDRLVKASTRLSLLTYGVGTGNFLKRLNVITLHQKKSRLPWDERSFPPDRLQCPN